jgi:hypothetical protein
MIPSQALLQGHPRGVVDAVTFVCAFPSYPKFPTSALPCADQLAQASTSDSDFCFTIFSSDAEMHYICRRVEMVEN